MQQNGKMHYFIYLAKERLWVWPGCVVVQGCGLIEGQSSKADPREW